ncbi:MAG: hypothetical protein J7L77_07420 [Clostridiales bacterium]|nr:hypothetical protein [Clostridiales bacterium]
MAKLWLNEDNSHYFGTRGEKASNPEEIRNFILQYKGTNVSRIILNGNGQKTSFPSKAGEVIYKNVKPGYFDNSQKTHLSSWFYAVNDLADKGIDLYTEWIDLLREINISPWMSMRMNDVHNANDEDHPMHSNFYKNNLNYRRAMHRDEKWEDRQLNYLIKDVQDYHFAILEEYFEKYDFDGIELDWMRFGNHFPVGYEDSGREVLNKFMKNTRELADKYQKTRGHKIDIAARVPVKPETAFDMGMDGVGWALSGYVNCLIPSPFWHTSQADIPVERWKRQVQGTGCLIAPCLEICLRQYVFPKCKNEFQFNTLETMRGAAISFIDRGADAVYLFNYMDEQKFAYDNSYYYKIISEIGDYELMQAGTRRTILTFNDRRPEGTASDERLPCILSKDTFAGFRLHTGNRQKNTDSLVLLSFKGKDKIENGDVNVFVNGEKCNFKNKDNAMSPKPVDTLFAWGIPAKAFKDGYQVIEVVANKDGYVIDWVEILCM